MQSQLSYRYNSNLKNNNTRLEVLNKCKKILLNIKSIEYLSFNINI